jgi:cellulose synthase/poly-beta-1,6-N-acetylglucosamine synthase-like glycosyltransferase
MITRALFLSLGWLIIAVLATLLGGTRLRRDNRLLSVLWLAMVLLVGDVWALLTFGIQREIAGLSLIALLAGYWWICRLPSWNALGQVAWHFSVLSTLLYLAYSFAVTAFTPLHPLAYLIAVTFFFVEVAALLLGLTYAHEALDRCCRIHWARKVTSLPEVPGYLPKVSFHVPAYNEPPELVADTLRALSQQAYPNYEVLLIDNNTPDERTWRPLEALCRELGPRFRALHLDQWPGYKSGALNFALAQTAPDAEIVAIVDADYQVEPNFLRELTPAFADPQVAFVQTPQDYRDCNGNVYLEATYHAYKYFFDVSMPVRNEHNAIIFGGTMGLVRKSALQEIGGWDEWCITEDAEASLRLLKRGYRSVYINQTYGRGLMPFTFEGLKKQRFRWCFGGIQILKKHWEALMPWAQQLEPDNQLTGAQRYYYLVSGLQWFNDLLNLVFAIFLLLGAILFLSPLEIGVRPFVGPLIVVPAIFLSLAAWRFLWVLRYALGLSIREALLAMGNFFSLGWAVTLGTIQGLIQPAGVFMRTPKSHSRSGLVRAIRATQWETSIGISLLSLGIAVSVLTLQPANIVLTVLMAWQAGLYLAAPMNSIVSIRGRPVEPLTSRADIAQREVRENWAARWVLGLVLLVLACGIAVRYAPAPTGPSLYAHLQPAKIPARWLIGIDTVPMEQRDQEQPPEFFLPTATPTPSATTLPGSTPPAFTPSATPNEAQTAEPTPLPALTQSPGPTPPTPTQPPAATPPAPTQPPPPSPPAPTQPPTPPAPTQPPTATLPVPTIPPAPTDPAPTEPPVPTVPAPTQSPVPTPPAPTQPPAPTAPAPTQPPVPTPPTLPSGLP